MSTEGKGSNKIFIWISRLCAKFYLILIGRTTTFILKHSDKPSMVCWCKEFTIRSANHRNRTNHSKQVGMNSSSTHLSLEQLALNFSNLRSSQSVMTSCRHDQWSQKTTKSILDHCNRVIGLLHVSI